MAAAGCHVVMLLFRTGENSSTVATPLIPIHRINGAGDYHHSSISCHALISMNLVDPLDGQHAASS
jgi:hypothetical protein